ncbi:UDP-4-amino-4,6-dideoxy-N-acetyl-beta-L-altrosamine N-acetyltransferase [Thiofilum flexile]|uniref:UDP-4-amino-4, 6-dideoxy-N-acetyl-beta-L-altrosamine N-acetyltransferase n=1 Tax=Thiofilum flexile TaxID=125627 RepID=UPI000373A170|nr:UDP-4-amino-4,6-dideoxy-N-acetyl-beta-L-altrosamine N-acetyltransferase [Thiofilum flexile]
MKSKFGILRSIKEDELELILSWRNHPDIRTHMYNQHEISINEHLKWWQNIKESKTDKYFIYELSETAFGVISFNNINHANRNSAWGFYRAPYAPKGTGTKMEFLMLEYGFNEIGLNKIYCDVLSTNPSLNIHKKFGFITEGIFREQYLQKNNLIDVYRLGILRKEWEKEKNAISDKLNSFL